MELEWLRIATSPGMWIIGFIIGGNALIQSVLFYRLALKYGRKMQIRDGLMREALKAALVTSVGPALGIFVGMTVLVIALGGAYAFQREVAGVGSIMSELIFARAGSEAAGVPLTREGMTAVGLATVCWAAAIGCVGWVVIGGVFTRSLPRLKDVFGRGDPKRIQAVTVAMMLGAFGRMLVTDAVKPLITGKLPPFAAALAAAAAALLWLMWADRARKPALKEYYMIVALIIGMAVGQLVRLATA